VLNPRRDSHLLSLGIDSERIVHLDQCIQAGLTVAKLHWLVSSGRWQSPLPRVYATFSGPIPYSARLIAAVLYAGDAAALSHATAGHRHRLCPRPSEIHVTVPYRRKVDEQPGLVLHRSRTLLDQAEVVGFPPTTTPERTVLDLLDLQPTVTAALALIGDAIRTRRTTAARLRMAIEASPCTRWRRPVLKAMPDVEAGAHSLLELEDATNRRRHGLPKGRRQKRRAADGTEYLDVFIEEWDVHVELDGRLGHDRTREIWRDMRRDNRSEVAQVRHLRYGWADMLDRGCEVAIQQAVVLRQQGWPGTFKRCPKCPSRLPAGL
jgi:hypothetical protein